jgi:hypothetical protein
MLRQNAVAAAMMVDVNADSSSGCRGGKISTVSIRGRRERFSWGQFAGLSKSHSTIFGTTYMLNREFDLTKPLEMLFRLFRNGKPGALKEFAELIARLPSEFATEFFSQFFKPAYVPVSGATQHVAKLRFTLPKRADELLVALRACQVDKS